MCNTWYFFLNMLLKKMKLIYKREKIIIMEIQDLKTAVSNLQATGDLTIQKIEELRNGGGGGNEQELTQAVNDINAVSDKLKNAIGGASGEPFLTDAVNAVNTALSKMQVVIDLNSETAIFDAFNAFGVTATNLKAAISANNKPLIIETVDLLRTDADTFEQSVIGFDSLEITAAINAINIALDKLEVAIA